MERTDPERSAGPYAGARLFGSFWGDCQKELAQQGETKHSSSSLNANESKTFIQHTQTCQSGVNPCFPKKAR